MGIRSFKPTSPARRYYTVSDFADITPGVEPLKGLCADGRTRWVAISGASNLTGHAPDLARAVAIAQDQVHLARASAGAAIRSSAWA